MDAEPRRQRTVSLPGNPTGADFMFMWATVLEGSDGLGSDFDFVYFVGPSDLPRSLEARRNGRYAKLEAYYDEARGDGSGHCQGRQAGVSQLLCPARLGRLQPGVHDEWNIAKAINDRRRARDQSKGIPGQLGILLTDMPCRRQTSRVACSPAVSVPVPQSSMAMTPCWTPRQDSRQAHRRSDLWTQGVGRYFTS